MRLLNLINSIPSDKLLHFVGGQIIWHVTFRVTGDVVIAHAVTAAAAIGKEVIIDAGLNLLAKRKGLPPPHSVDPKDAIATYLGGVAQHLTRII